MDIYINEIVPVQMSHPRCLIFMCKIFISPIHFCSGKETKSNQRLKDINLVDR